MVAAQPFVCPDELEDRRVEGVERGSLAVHHVAVEVRWAAHGLARVVDDVIEPIARRQHVPAERLDARGVAQVESEHLESVTPLGEVGLGCVPCRSVTRETGGHDERDTASQQLDSRLVTDLHPPARQERDPAGEVGELAAFGVVELGALRAQLVVEVVHLVVLGLADVTVLRFDGFAVRGLVDVVLHETAGGVDVGGGEHGLFAQRANPRLCQHRLVALHLRRATLALERLRSNASFLGIGEEHVAGGVDQVDLLLGRQDRQQVA